MRPYQSGVPSLSFSEDMIAKDNGDFSYLQEIHVDGTKSASLQYAFKPKWLPGKQYPGLNTDEDGWITFGEGNIWTSQSELKLNFDSVNGSLQNLITEVTVKLKYPDGRIQELYSPFKSTLLLDSNLENSITPGAQLSAGIEFRLRESMADVFVDGMYADHFMYRLNYLNAGMETISTGEWYSSIDSPDIRKVHLSLSTQPALSYNMEGTFTQFEYYVVSRLGLEQAVPRSIHFQIVDGFKPLAKIYPQTVVGFGNYHYGFNPELTLDNRQFIPGSGERFNRNLWMENGIFTAINSADFKLHLHWGHHGLYYDRNSNLPVDNPLSGVISNTVLSPAGINYGSSIVAYWLQLDGDEFPLRSNQLIGHQVLTDDQGQTWTRILNLNHAFRYTILQNMSDGIHIVRVKAEDLQGVTSDPTQIEINLKPYKAAHQRSGILIVDNDQHAALTSPEAFVDDFYTGICPDFVGAVDQIDFATTDFLSPTLMMDYKAVIIHSDNYNISPNFVNMFEGLNIYLENQGNLIISSTDKLKSALQQLTINPGGQSFLQSKLGITDLDHLGAIAHSMSSNNFFESAIGMQGFTDIPLNIETAFNPLVIMRLGISCVTYFEPSSALDFTFALGCKQVGADAYSPTQEQYNLLSSKYVAYRHSNRGGKVYLFGFPLSYMQKDAVSEAMQQIWTEIVGTPVAKGRNK